MNAVRMFLTAVAAAAMLAPAALAQDMQAPKPGPEHAKLKKMEGAWDCTVSMQGAPDSKATANFKMEVGGLWLTSTFEGTMMGGPFVGRGLDSYDATKKKYVSVWVDSWTTSPLVMEGDYDAAGKKCTMVGEVRGPDGKMHKHTITTEMVDDNTVHFAMYMGDAKEPGLKIVYKRRK